MMMSRRDTETRAALNVLGLTPAASANEIVTAYRRLARSTHPDLCPAPGAESRFVTLSAAYHRALDAAGQGQEPAPATAVSSKLSPTRAQTRNDRQPVQFAAGPVHYRLSPPAPASEKG